MDRRRFLAIGSAAFLARNFPVGIAEPAELSLRPEGPSVLEVAGVSEQTVAALFEALGGLRGLMKNDPAVSTIVLKPNICLPDSPEKATTTSPALVELICNFLIAQGARKIVVVDHTLRTASEFEWTAWFDLPKKHPEVKLLLANEQRFFEPFEVSGAVLSRTEVLRILPRADLWINLPTAKHHSATHVSLGIKNLMGVIWNRSDFHTSLDLDRAIADLARVFRPALTIVDASRVLLNGGPTGPGRILQENRLFASTDPVAVDAVVSSRYSFGGKNLPPANITHLQAAADALVGEIDLARIRVRKV